MDNEDAIQFLLSIAREIKRSFESPVIFFTVKDYAGCIFNTLVDMRTALLQQAKPERVFEIIHSFHFKWLQDVQDIENFKKRINDTPRESILKAIDYTIQRVHKRREYFKKYITHYKNIMTLTEKISLRTDLAIIRDMEEIIIFALIEKKRCLSTSADRSEFYIIVSHETEELLNWLDRLNDYLAINFSKVVDLTIPNIISVLTKSLQQITDEVTDISAPEAKRKVQELGIKSKSLSSIARVVNSLNDLKIGIIVDKIQNLEKRIEHLKSENPPAVIALQHKTMYLEDRLQSLENLKVSVNLLRNKALIHRTESDKVLNEEDIRIFNHLLPHHHRYRLVENIVKLWQKAIIGEQKSIISILSETDLKQVFSDELGNFSIDKYGRKIYKKPGQDSLFQLNENNELVQMRDDKHVYFYDECGRYYLNSDKMRVYKAHARANEYMLHRGVLLKLSEVDDDIEYQYDLLGRYYINENGSRIYREKNSKDDYVPDGLGNLVRLHHDVDLVYDYCPVEPIQTPSSLYLKEHVGDALKTVLAQVILAQPLDPIKYLADGLEKYHFNKLAKQKGLIELEQLLVERERLRDDIKGSSQVLHSSSPSVEGDQATPDYNFINYQSKLEDNNNEWVVIKAPKIK